MSETGGSGDGRRRPLKPSPSHQAKKKARQLSPVGLRLRALAALESDDDDDSSSSGGEDARDDAKECKRREGNAITPVSRAMATGRTGILSADVDTSAATSGPSIINLADGVVAIVELGGQTTGTDSMDMVGVEDDEAEPSNSTVDWEKRSSGHCNETRTPVGGGTSNLKVDEDDVTAAEVDVPLMETKLINAVSGGGDEDNGLSSIAEDGAKSNTYFYIHDENKGGCGDMKNDETVAKQNEPSLSAVRQEPYICQLINTKLADAADDPTKPDAAATSADEKAGGEAQPSDVADDVNKNSSANHEENQGRDAMRTNDVITGSQNGDEDDIIVEVLSEPGAVAECADENPGTDPEGGSASTKLLKTDSEPSSTADGGKRNSVIDSEDNQGRDVTKANDGSTCDGNGTPSLAEDEDTTQIKRGNDVLEVLTEPVVPDGGTDEKSGDALPATGEESAVHEFMACPYPPTSEYADILPLPMFLSTPFHGKIMLSLKKLKEGIEHDLNKNPSQNYSIKEWASSYIDNVPIVPQKKFIQRLKEKHNAPTKHSQSLTAEAKSETVPLSSKAISTKAPLVSNQQQPATKHPSREPLNNLYPRMRPNQQQPSFNNYPTATQQQMQQHLNQQVQQHVTTQQQMHQQLQHQVKTQQQMQMQQQAQQQLVQQHLAQKQLAQQQVQQQVAQRLLSNPPDHLQSKQPQQPFQYTTSTNRPTQQATNQQMRPNFTSQMHLPNSYGYTQQQNSYNHMPMPNAYNHFSHPNPMYQQTNNGWQNSQPYVAHTQAGFPNAGIQNAYNSRVSAMQFQAANQSVIQENMARMVKLRAANQQQQSKSSQPQLNVQTPWNNSRPTAQSIHGALSQSLPQSLPQSHVVKFGSAAFQTNVNAGIYPVRAGAPATKPVSLPNGIHNVPRGTNQPNATHKAPVQLNILDAHSNHSAQFVAAYPAKEIKPKPGPKVVMASEEIKVSAANAQTAGRLPIAFGFYLDDKGSSKKWAQTVSENWTANGRRAIRKDSRLSVDGKDRRSICSTPRGPKTLFASTPRTLKTPAILLSTEAATNLPKGWTVKTFKRMSGKTVGTTDKYFYSPKAEIKFRAMTSCSKFLQILDEPGVDGDEKHALRMFKERGHRI